MRSVALVALLAAADASANSGGFAGASGKPGSGSCIDPCHGGGGNKGSVTLKGPTVMGSGETGTFTIVITSASPMKQKHAGVDVAASAGTLAVRPGGNATKLLNGEIVHERTAGPGDPIEFQFDFTAPPSGGTVTLFGAALSADGNGMLGGDSMMTTKVDVMVTAPDLSGIDFSGVTFDLTPPPEPDLTVGPDLMPAPVKPDEPRWGCGCALGARPSTRGGAWALLLLLALGRRRRLEHRTV